MAEATRNYLSLFAGYGGLDVAIRAAAPGARCVGYVEREAAAVAILAARMADGGLDEAPIWSDVRTFPSGLFRGRVGGIVGGFPCQDLSVAGRRAGIHGDRSGLFFEISRLVRELESVEWLFLENVPPAIAFPAGTTILGELASLGFDAEWTTLRASDVGAPHRRDRVFVLAYRPDVEYADDKRIKERWASDGISLRHAGYADEGHETAESGIELAQSTGRGLGILRHSSGGDGFADGGEESVGDAIESSDQRIQCRFCCYWFDASLGKYGCPNCESVGLADTSRPRLQRRKLSGPYGAVERSKAHGPTAEFCSALFPPGPPTPLGGPTSSPTGPTLRRRLNPNFVDWLMGLCPGWTDSAPLETASYLSRVRSHLRSLLGD